MTIQYKIIHCFLIKYCQECTIVLENVSEADGILQSTHTKIVVPSTAVLVMHPKNISQIHKNIRIKELEYPVQKVNLHKSSIYITLGSCPFLWLSKHISAYNAVRGVIFRILPRALEYALISHLPSAAWVVTKASICKFGMNTVKIAFLLIYSRQTFQIQYNTVRIISRNIKGSSFCLFPLSVSPLVCKILPTLSTCMQR